MPWTDAPAGSQQPRGIETDEAIHDIIAAKEKQATAKQAFVFHAALTSKRPMKSGMKR